VKKNLVLLGMMGVGKSTLGRIVAKKQKLEFIDTDDRIEEKFSMKIADIFKKKGEEFFRIEEEKEVLESIEKNNCVIALGGGAFLNEAIRRQILKKTTSVWLNCDSKILYERIKRNKKRPLLNNGNVQKKIGELYSKRKNIYKLANYKINCDNQSKKNIVKKILSFYEKK